MKMKKIFIDGSAGTTGLRIRERLGGRQDICLLTIPEELRKDPAARKEIMNEADLVFFCLPDAAAMEAAQLIENPETVVIDTSTAHRVSEDWTYGMPELPGMKEKIRGSKRIANPGCHASGFIALAAPLTAAGIIPASEKLSAFSLTGYSGGGKKMIADYEADGRDPLYDAPRQYGLSQSHKHLPEMAKFAGLAVSPVFCPIVSDYYAGMEVTVPFFLPAGVTAEDVRNAYREAYPGPVIRFAEGADEGGFLSAGAFAGRDDMEITVYGNEERLILTARFDNLGKGASGAAVQNMNLVLGFGETEGLVIL